MNYKKLITLTGIFTLMATLPLLGSIQTNAEDEIAAQDGIIISPAIMELAADRGGSYEFTMRIENDTQKPELELTPFTQKFTSNDDAGTPVLQPITEADTESGWVTFSEPKYTIAQKDSTNARFSVTIPEDTAPGSYYLAISYTTDNSRSGGDSEVVIDTEISGLLFITVKGQITREANFESFESKNVIVDPLFDDLLLTYKIGSEGNAYLKPSGNIFVGLDPESPDQNLQLNPNEKIILPNTTRTFHQLTESRFDFGMLSNKVDINSLSGDINKNELDMPVVKAEEFEAVVVYANSQGLLEQKSTTITVYFFPWKTIILAIALGVLSYLIYRVVSQNIKTRKTK